MMIDDGETTIIARAGYFTYSRYHNTPNLGVIESFDVTSVTFGIEVEGKYQSKTIRGPKYVSYDFVPLLLRDKEHPMHN
jgi:hypothetical protein